MKAQDTGKDRIRKICEILRHETLEPAVQEAQELVKQAEQEAEMLIEQAQKKIKKLREESEKEIEQKRRVFEASLSQASRQAIEMLKNQIEERLLQRPLSEMVAKHMKDPQVMARLISAVVHGIEKEGLEGNLTVVISEKVPAREVNAALAKEVLEKLKEKSVQIGPIEGGAEIKLDKDQITIDISERTIREMIAEYIRKDFRELFFEAGSEKK